MSKSIVFKWFVLTALLFSAMFLVIGIAQNYLFEQYYINKRVEDLKTQINKYSDRAAKYGVETASEQFYQNNQIWITKLDQFGSISEVQDYYIEVSLEHEFLDEWQIPMYPFEGQFSSDVFSLLAVGDQVIIDAINTADAWIPYHIQTSSTGVINLVIANKLHGPQADPAYSHVETGVFKGTITKTVFPEQMELISFPYQEQFFLEQIKQFQIRLLAEDAQFLQRTEEVSVTENFVDYQIIITPIIENGVMHYIFAISSLQPIDEALSVIKQFYPYFLGAALLLIVLLAYILSKWLAKPLISINRITNKIAKFDFTEKLPSHSADEIGQLSKNINYLSSQVAIYIGRLEQDLEKERKLETVRKEFIAGVSHELKTPLAVMKSCISIVNDGIAAEKEEHYFQAMEDEIERMDTLVVNMLDLAKFESGSYKPDTAPFAIDSVITDVCRSLTDQIQAKDIILRLNLGFHIVIGHRGLISRVISNFLSNAIQHSDNGHEITITVQTNDQEADISVENQGHPIPEENIDKIWNQFYRGETQTSKEGTGLGLSISKEILELHNSHYGVENTQDGVRFFFTLVLQQL